MSKVPGLSLADIGRLHKDVPVGDGEDQFLRVYGISAEDILALLQRYPETLIKALQGGVEFKDIIKAAPNMVSALIAAAVGKLGDAEAEAMAKRVPIELQFDILEAVGGLTFKNGFGPFAKRVLDLADRPELKSFGKVPATNSQPQSKPSSQPATLPSSSGD